MHWLCLRRDLITCLGRYGPWPANPPLCISLHSWFNRHRPPCSDTGWDVILSHCTQVVLKWISDSVCKFFMTDYVLPVTWDCRHLVSFCILISEPPSLLSIFLIYFLFVIYLFICLFYYSYVHTRLWSFLPPDPTPSLTTHPTPSLSPPPPEYPEETILPLSLILLKRDYKK
jgi:hypothetical protein